MQEIAKNCRKLQERAKNKRHLGTRRNIYPWGVISGALNFLQVKISAKNHFLPVIYGKWSLSPESFQPLLPLISTTLILSIINFNTTNNHFFTGTYIQIVTGAPFCDHTLISLAGHVIIIK